MLVRDLASGLNGAAELQMCKQFEDKWRELEKANWLPGLFYRLGVPQHDIPDLINETAYQAFRSIQTLEDWDAFDRWVGGIARHIYMRYRRDAFSREMKREMLTGEFMVSRQDSPDRSVYDKLMVEECLRRLDKLDQDIVVYRALEGYKWDEISKLVGKPRASVARHYQKAISRLRLCIETHTDR